MKIEESDALHSYVDTVFQYSPISCGSPPLSLPSPSPIVYMNTHVYVTYFFNVFESKEPWHLTSKMT